MKNLNKEWDFIINEINVSNKGGTKKGKLLFEFQILLNALSKIKNKKEKQMLFSIYRKRKSLYKRI